MTKRTYKNIVKMTKNFIKFLEECRNGLPKNNKRADEICENYEMVLTIFDEYLRILESKEKFDIFLKYADK